MTTILDISDELLAFRDALVAAVDGNGELSPDAEKALDQWFAGLTHDRDVKIDAYVAVCREAKLRAEARRAEAERLQALVKADEAIERRLKERLKLFLELQGEKRVETRRYRLTVCNNGGKTPLQVDGLPEALPREYQRVEIKPNEEAIRARLEAGGALVFARLLPRGTHLRIT